ncbi:MAG: hypothetical protein EA383_14985 [Spirochaetaceae bacterium]|nr:MAG: hypothetical protein EA383_14985 [Spirochaetaceae bacterium]
MNTLIPPVASNEYRGSRIALAVFAVLTGVSIIRSLIHILAPDGGAASIATIPLDAYSADAAATVIHVFALWGLSQLLFALVSLAVLFRYRTLIPLMYLLSIGEYTVRLVLGFVKPITLAGTAPGGVANYVLVPILIVLFILSMKTQKPIAVDRSLSD